MLGLLLQDVDMFKCFLVDVKSCDEGIQVVWVKVEGLFVEGKIGEVEKEVSLVIVQYGLYIVLSEFSCKICEFLNVIVVFLGGEVVMMYIDQVIVDVVNVKVKVESVVVFVLVVILVLMFVVWLMVMMSVGFKLLILFIVVGVVVFLIVVFFGMFFFGGDDMLVELFMQVVEVGLLLGIEIGEMVIEVLFIDFDEVFQVVFEMESEMVFLILEFELMICEIVEFILILIENMLMGCF